MEKNHDRLLTLAETAARLGLRVATLRSWRLRRKNLPFVALGERAVRVRESDLEKLIGNGTVLPREVEQ